MGLERDHLARAFRHIELAERRIFEQRVLIDRMTKRGLDITLAESLLETMLSSLERMHEHRELIESAISAGRE
jgi:hypothetical protein